jgi:membrane-associated phospholipid phosphatase
MNETAALLDWGAAVSFGYLTTLTVAAVQLPYLLIAAAVLVGVVSLWGKPRQFARYLLSLLVAGLAARLVIVEAVRILIQTVRPYVALSFAPLIEPVQEHSFPSGHVSVLAALAFTAWRTRPAAGAALFAGAIIVGVARVLAGVHWPVDILGGMAVGALTALLVHVLMDRIFKQ